MKNIKTVFLELDKIRIPDDRRQVIFDNIIKSCLTVCPDKSGGKKFPRRVFVLTASMLSIAVFAVIFINLPDRPLIIEAIPTNVATGSVSTEPTVQQKIVYACSDHLSMDEVVPNLGVCLLGYELKQAIEDPENENALFYVYLEAYIPSSIDSSFKYEGKTLAEWKTIELEYDKNFNEFLKGKIEENSDYTAADKEAWLKEWEAVHGEDPSVKYSEAVKAISKESKTAEAQRLSSCGINIELKENGDYYYMTGFLTKEQIQTFPCGEAGYYLLLIKQSFNGYITEGIDE